MQIEENSFNHLEKDVEVIAWKNAIDNGAPAILGHPDQCLGDDYKFQDKLHIENGEILAQAALQTEILICNVANVPIVCQTYWTITIPIDQSGACHWAPKGLRRQQQIGGHP